MVLKPMIQLAKGLASYLPGASDLMRSGGGDSGSARYCYSVWLRHLVMAHNHGFTTEPKVVAELGPGRSIGMGLAALLSGAEQYWALDVVAYADISSNLVVLDSLKRLFEQRAPIPDDREFPNIKPTLTDYSFPAEILTEERLAMALAPERVAGIRDRLMSAENRGSFIRYVAPWVSAAVLRRASVDMIFSQAVLEHVDDLEQAYVAMANWLTPTGFMSHQIDFKCHGTARQWNGHWACSDWRWRLIRGRRPYLINRAPRSVHLHWLRRAGLEVEFEQKASMSSAIRRRDLAHEFQNLSDDDLHTCGLFVQARKPVSEDADPSRVRKDPYG